MKYVLLSLLIFSGGATASPVHLSCQPLRTPYISKKYYAQPQTSLSDFQLELKWIKDVALLNGGYVFITEYSETTIYLTIDVENSLGWWSAQDVGTVGTFPIKTNNYRNTYEWWGLQAGQRSISYEIDRSSLILDSTHVFSKKFQQDWLEMHGKPFEKVLFYKFQCKIDNQKI